MNDVAHTCNIAAMADTTKSGWIASGPRVLAFERALSASFGGRHHDAHEGARPSRFPCTAG
ncbi:hypothetical protein [Massilia rhizosphaerae]|uniref:hypothetical protein n=1 Tax=Massilia rhizosphaerae TaxID=2784389 RepID=UPI0018DC605C|nr:hypothetical protein [Massilia rhizosphaerae]